LPGPVIFRADAAPQLGFGHVARCLALAEALGELGFRSIFVTHAAGVRAPIEADGHEVRPARGPAAPGAKQDAADAAELAALAGETAASIVVVDHYGASSEYLSAVASGPWKLVLLEDGPGRSIDSVDLLINPNLGAPREESRALAGPRYALVRKAFVARREASLAARGGPIRRVMVAVGGAGTLARSAAVARELRAVIPARAEIHIVEGHTAGKEAGRGLAGLDRVQRVGPLDPAGMAEEMAASQVAVATPSTICWELAALGVPMALVKTAANQIAAAELAARGLARVMTPDEPISLAFDGPAGYGSEAVRLRVSKEAAELVDGRGAERCARAIADLAGEERGRPAP